MKVLITGAAGLLGANFTRYLIGKGYDIVGIDDFSGGYRSSVPDGIRMYTQDLIEAKRVNEIFENEKPDYVYHFAAYAAEGLSPFIRNYNYTNNILCSINVINACVNNDVKKVIFTSSMAIYGEGNPPFTEDQPAFPEDPYGIAKYAVEQDLRLAKMMFDLDYSVIRPHNVIGLYQNIWDRYRNVIGIWIRKILDGAPLTIFGDGTQRRAFSDIDFYMEPFEKFMLDRSTDSGAYNIGADKDYTINEAADLLIEVAGEFGYDASKEYLEARKEVHTAFSDHTKAREHLGFEDNTDLKKTMRDMFKWALDQPERDIKDMEYEIEKNMYSFWKK